MPQVIWFSRNFVSSKVNSVSGNALRDFKDFYLSSHVVISENPLVILRLFQLSSGGPILPESPPFYPSHSGKIILIFM